MSAKFMKEEIQREPHCIDDMLPAPHSMATNYCYNPNEETRLRAVIDAVGRGAFNEKVRSLAVAVCTTPSARRSWDKESNDHAPEIVKEEFLSYVKNEGNEL